LFHCIFQSWETLETIGYHHWDFEYPQETLCFLCFEKGPKVCFQ
jgi:hypothetical protein